MSSPCSGDDPGCKQVLDAVYLYLDNEMDLVGESDVTIVASSTETVRIHLDECSPCLRQYGLEQAVKKIVGRCCGQEVAPAELRARVLTRLEQVRVEIEHVEFRAE